MTHIASISAPTAATPPLRMLLRGLLIATGVALWLLFLPALLARTGMVSEAQDCRLSASYRDPVTGRTAHPSYSGIALTPCPSPRP